MPVLWAQCYNGLLFIGINPKDKGEPCLQKRTTLWCWNRQYVILWSQDAVTLYINFGTLWSDKLLFQSENENNKLFNTSRVRSSPHPVLTLCIFSPSSPQYTSQTGYLRFSRTQALTELKKVQSAARKITGDARIFHEKTSNNTRAIVQKRGNHKVGSMT